MRQWYSSAVRLLALAAVTAITVVLSNSLWAQDAPPLPPKVADSTLPPGTSVVSPFQIDANAAQPQPALPPPSAVSPRDPSPEDPFLSQRVLPSPSRPLPHNPPDPEAAAKGFVERSIKEADDAIKALTAESESLNIRLHKVEAGLERWREVKAALESHSRSTSRSSGRMDRHTRTVDAPRPLDVDRETLASPNPFREPAKGDTVPPPVIRESVQKK